MSRSASVVAEEAEARHCSAAFVSPSLSKSRVLRIHILTFSSSSMLVESEDKVSKCRFAVSNSPISSNSPATRRPRSCNLAFHSAKLASSDSVLAFAARVRHSVDNAYNPMIVLLCTSAPCPCNLSSKRRNGQGTCERKISRWGRV